MSDFSKIYAKLDRLANYLENTAPTIIGVEAVNHFQESFDKQGFTDENLEKWENVKRRDSGSSWYGFKYQSKVAKPGKRQRKQGSTTNYSPAAAQRPILSGDTQQLRNSLRWQKIGRGARVTAGTAYAQIQNEGGNIKVFGKASAKMPKRQFMGESAALRRRIQQEIKKDIINILRS